MSGFLLVEWCGGSPVPLLTQSVSLCQVWRVEKKTVLRGEECHMAEHAGIGARQARFRLTNQPLHGKS
jgi:transposase